MQRRRAPAWAGAVTGVAGPLAVAVLLPDPRGQLTLLGDPRADIAIGAVATLVATGAVYLLLAWAAAIVLTALAGRAPGALGRAGRRALLRITPAVVRQLVVTAAGLSLATGLAACGGQPSAPSSMTATPATVQQAVAPQPVQQGVRTVAFALDAPAADPAGARASAGEGPMARPETLGVPTELTVDLDWPVTRPDPESATSPAPQPATPGAMTIDPAAEPADAAVGAQTATPQVKEDPAAKPRPSGIDGIVVVHRGDSLWSIAAAHLPPDAGAAQIDAAWRDWYRANRDVIGPDPSLILPGQQLRTPAAHPAPGESGITVHSTRPHGGLR